MTNLPNNSAIDLFHQWTMSLRTSVSLVLLFSLLLLGALIFYAVPHILINGMFPERRPARFSEAAIDLFASDAHFVVGGVPLVAPFIALSDYTFTGASFSLDRRRDAELARGRREAFREATSDPQAPAAVDLLEISVHVYGADDMGQAISRVCPRLTRQWARSICKDAWSPIIRAVPDSFRLADDRKFDAFGGYSTIGGERVLDQLRSMQLKPGEAAVACDKTVSATTRSCTAAILIKDHLAAVWNVTEGKSETPHRRAAREGRAITALILYALSSPENFPVLFWTTCGLDTPTRYNRCGGAR